MAEPFDYSINVPNPLQGFMQGMQVGTALRQQREKQAKAEKIQNMIQTLRTNPSPDNFAAVYAEAPELIEPLQRWQQSLDAPKQNAILGVLRNVKPLLDTNKTDLALGELDRSISAFENTPGFEKEVAVLKETRRLYELNPDAGKMRVNSALYALAPDEYKNVWSATSGGDSTFIKELVAEGLQPGTPEFQDALRKKREGDPFVVVPGVGLYYKRDILGAADDQRVTASIPQAAINYLRQNPQMRDAFDQKYGKGAADRILGKQ